MERGKTRIVNKILKEKDKSWTKSVQTLLDFTTDYKATLTNTMWNWQKNRSIKHNRECRNKSIHIQPIGFLGGKDRGRRREF